MSARRIAALLEVLGVYVTGQYLVTLLASAFGLLADNPLTHVNAQITNAELLFATRDIFFLLLMRYAGWFLLIVPINWWHRRSGPAAYGFTRARKSWNVLLAAGVATAALAAWPEMGVQLLDRVYALGFTAPWRSALFEMSWRRWEFWLFTAVVGWAFVAFMEELFYRGYCQRRLAEDWGDGPAILGTSCLFVFSHDEYLSANLYSISSLASLLVLSVALGIVFAWTRSLVPSVIAHSIINIPMTPFWQALAIAVFMLGTVLLSRRGVAVVRQVFAGAPAGWSIALAAVAAVYAVASQRPAAVYVAASMLGLAVGLEAMHRGQDGNNQPVPTLLE